MSLMTEDPQVTARSLAVSAAVAAIASAASTSALGVAGDIRAVGMSTADMESPRSAVGLLVIGAASVVAGSGVSATGELRLK